MTLEQALAENTAAVKELTAAIKAGGGAASSSSGSSSSSGGSSKPANTRAAMQAALASLKDKKGAEAAKGVIKDAGGVVKMADIPEDKIDAVFNACQKALAEEDI